nr:MAG TPA: hypothetical protein [Caudoviricetes sp.]
MPDTIGPNLRGRFGALCCFCPCRSSARFDELQHTRHHAHHARHTSCPAPQKEPKP